MKKELQWTENCGKMKSYGKYFTMLQKISKCEVKAGLCWNMIILLPLRFYVKSNFGEFKRSKSVIFGNFIDSELWIFGKFRTWKLLKFTKIKIENLKNCQKWRFLTVWIRQNWISRKIWVLVKWPNFKCQALTSHFASFWSIVY